MDGALIGVAALQLPCSLVVVGVGVKPEVELFKDQLPLADGGGIQVDDSLRPYARRALGPPQSLPYTYPTPIPALPSTSRKVSDGDLTWPRFAWTHHQTQAALGGVDQSTQPSWLAHSG